MTETEIKNLEIFLTIWHCLDIQMYDRSIKGKGTLPKGTPLKCNSQNQIETLASPHLPNGPFTSTQAQIDGRKTMSGHLSRICSDVHSEGVKAVHGKCEENLS